MRKKYYIFHFLYIMKNEILPILIASWIKLLIEHGAEVCAKNNQSLKWAIDSRNYDIAMFLIESGADLHTDNDYAFQKSVIQNSEQMVKYLLNMGADIKLTTPETIKNAIKNRSYDTIQLLIENGLDLSFLVKNNSSDHSKNSIKIFNHLLSIGMDLTTAANIFIN